MKVIVLLSIGLFFGAGVGFLMSGSYEVEGHDHGEHASHGNDHELKEESHGDHAMHGSQDHSDHMKDDSKHGADAHSGQGHDHSAMIEWPASLSVPEVSLELYEDGATSRNLRVVASGYRWAPEEVNGPVTDGAGHAHLYINGKKAARLYGEWFHLTNFPSHGPDGGPVTVRVTLNANSHAGWMKDGKVLAGELSVPSESQQ